MLKQKLLFLPWVSWVFQNLKLGFETTGSPGCRVTKIIKNPIGLCHVKKVKYEFYFSIIRRSIIKAKLETE